jgi:hypothetical protein
VESKLLIVKLGGLEPLIRQMLSPNIEVQYNAVGCIANLATHGMQRSTVDSANLFLFIHAFRWKQGKDRPLRSSYSSYTTRTIERHEISWQRN